VACQVAFVSAEDAAVMKMDLVPGSVLSAPAGQSSTVAVACPSEASIAVVPPAQLIKPV